MAAGVGGGPTSPPPSPPPHAVNKVVVRPRRYETGNRTVVGSGRTIRYSALRMCLPGMRSDLEVTYGRNRVPIEAKQGAKRRICDTFRWILSQEMLHDTARDRVPARWPGTSPKARA